MLLKVIWAYFILIPLVTEWTNVRNEVHCQQISSSNTPPVMYVEQHWRISELEEVGSIIARVRAEDAENDILRFGLEPHYLNTGRNSESYPFRIDPATGIVYLNETLQGRGGENFFLYITVFDGQLTAKNEVYVNIIKSGDKNKLYDNRTPSFTQTVRNLSQVLPPFHLLPGVINRPTGNIVPQFPASLPTTSTPKSQEEVSNTKLTKVDDTHNATLKGQVANDNLNLNNTILTLPEKDSSSYKIILAITLTLLVVFIIAICVTLYIRGRRTVFNFGGKFSKKGKGDLKKSNLSNNFNSNTDESQNSMVLNNWIGPLALHNRYVPWERDSPQVATSHLGDFHSQNNNAVDPWEFPRHKLKFFNILGEGAFGQVWRCEAININGNEGITTVAVKTLKENATEFERKDLQSELQVMKSLDPHTNVVRFLGCCTEKEPLFVIIEYVNGGKLQSYLRSSRAERNYGNTHGKSNILTSADLTSFMYQVAKGMDYLTSKGIIHRDLAARNILITDDHTCKVADFGFARDVIESKIYERKSEGKLPIRWMAVESLYDNLFSVKSDIWSFGILMWEIVTLGSTPYPGISAADVMKKIRDGFRLEKPEHCRRELYNIMYYTWAKDPNERPSFAEIVQMLDKLLHTEMDYIELERFPDHNYYNIVSLSGEKL